MPPLDIRALEPLVAADYSLESAFKNKVIVEFFKQQRHGIIPETLVPSLLPRHYRTVTKRTVHTGKWRTQLICGAVTPGREVPVGATASQLEPLEHQKIFTGLETLFNMPRYRPIVHHCTYVIVRNNGGHYTVLFNMRQLSASIMRSLKNIAEQMQKTMPQVISVFVFFDPSDSGYYLDSGETATPKLKRLYGPGVIFTTMHGKRYGHTPAGFSQVNTAGIELVMARVRQELQGSKTDRLIDLFCGYGLFACYAGADFGSVWGIDISGDAIESAVQNWSHFYKDSRAHFKTAPITAHNLKKLLPPTGDCGECIILDPPRQGFPVGVVDVVAARRPRTIIHLSCGIDTLPRQLDQWEHQGYAISRIVPFDMFAGTLNIETLVVLTRKK